MVLSSPALLLVHGGVPLKVVFQQAQQEGCIFLSMLHFGIGSGCNVALLESTSPTVCTWLARSTRQVGSRTLELVISHSMHAYLGCSALWVRHMVTSGRVQSPSNRSLGRRQESCLEKVPSS